MRALKTTIFAVLAVCTMAGASQAGVYYFQPTPRADLWDLDHYRFYTWGIEWNQPGETIVGAELTFTNIWDWRVEDDFLYSALIDNPALGVKSMWDNEGGGNNFANNAAYSSQMSMIGTWSDSQGGRSRGYTLNYDLGTLGLLGILNDYAADGVFGFGFDPDCHYYNSGLTVKITTAPTPQPGIPEPATLAMLGLGLAGLRLFRHKK